MVKEHISAFQEEALKAIHARAHDVAQHLRLSLYGQVWQGQTGLWPGMGTGNAIDFQDHRPYYPGDNPRHIDWHAYARTEHYVMKLYREEVSPRVDVVLDVSESMFFEETKRIRTLELFYFVIESALHAGASICCTLAHGSTQHAFPVEAILTYRLPVVDPPSGLPLDITDMPWRYSALRIVISDLLFPGQPTSWIAGLGARQGCGMLLAPFSLYEASPEWAGHTTFVDCETRTQQRQQVSADVLARYKQRYARHFSMWREACTRYGLCFARVPADGDFSHALRFEAIGTGAVASCV